MLSLPRSVKALLCMFLILSLFADPAAMAETEAEKALGVSVSGVSVDQLPLLIDELLTMRGYIDELIVSAEARLAAESAEDYTSMILTDAVNLAGLNAKNDVCSLLSFDAADPEVIILDVDMDVRDSGYALSCAICYCIDTANALFQRNDVPMLYLKFWEPGRDKNGNAVDMMTITMRLRKTTAEKMDMDYFYQYPANNQLRFLNAIDGYSLHKDYKAVAQ